MGVCRIGSGPLSKNAKMQFAVERISDESQCLPWWVVEVVDRWLRNTDYVTNWAFTPCNQLYNAVGTTALVQAVVKCKRHLTVHVDGERKHFAILEVFAFMCA